MDIELLSRMIGEIVLTHDRVGLPGMGTFVTEEVPASFSDRGYTINPPYRKLAFRSGSTDDRTLAEFYAASNNVDVESAEAILKQFLAELKDELRTSKTVAMPGMGKLRATRENSFFFVADEELDIYPEAFGLDPVSLKARNANTQEIISELPDLQKPVVEEELPPVQEAVETKPKETAHFRWGLLLVVLVSIAAILLLAFMVTAKLAPSFIDSILYTPEELRIINMDF